MFSQRGGTAPMDVTNQHLVGERRTKQKTSKNTEKWRCDVCETRFFPTFEEACLHEEACRQEQKKQRRQQKQQAPSNASFFAPRQPATSTSTAAIAVSPPIPIPAASGKRGSRSITATAAAATTTNSRAQNQQKQQSSEGKKPQHCFFQPRSKKPRTVRSLKPSSVIVEIQDDSPPSRKRPFAQKEPKVITQDSAQDMANALANMIDNKLLKSKPAKSSKPKPNKPLAALFQGPSAASSSACSKELLAEQRQAEFQAKRRLERQREQERQQKRQASRKHVPPLGLPPQAATAKCTAPLPPRAPRFPVPCHVGCSTTPTTTSSFVLQVPPSWITQSHTAIPSQNVSPKRLISSPSALDANGSGCGNDDSELHIQQALHSVLIPPSSKRQPPPKGLFVDQYALPLVGETADVAMRTLQRWIKKWCQFRHTAMDRMMERQRKLANKKKKAKKLSKRKNHCDHHDDDDDDDDYLWNDEELGNVFLLTGPPGAGKTALVHTVAAQCQCPVLEINTTQARGGAALRHAIQEATQSCSSLDLIQRQSKQHDLEDDDGDDNDEKSRTKLTVILIDEVDLLFDEHGDSGFWSGLISVAKTAKCPILLTANHRIPRLATIPNAQSLELKRPSPENCRTKLLQVCRHEGIHTRPELTMEVVQGKLIRVAELCQCDVRKMMHELQSFCHSKPVDTIAMDQRNEGPKEGLPSRLATRLPRLESIKPARVASDQYSVVTVTGKGFGILEHYHWQAVIGQQACKGHVVDDETLLVLCPPNDGCVAAPVSIQCSNGCVLRGDRVAKEELPGTSHLLGRHPHHVHFYQDERLSSDDENDEEECEFEHTTDDGKCQKASVRDVVTRESIEERGMNLWDTVVADTKTVPTNLERQVTTSQQDIELLATLNKLSENTQLLSDAAMIEDFQHGLPFLSGACKGFGFDMTDSNQGEGGKPKKDGSIRPPREDRLFDLGWKDNCYFFGDPDTYVSLPSTTHERRLIFTTMMTRHEVYYNADSSPNENADEAVDTDDPEEIVDRHVSSLASDGMFLPHQSSALVLSLPTMLRERAGEAVYSGDLTNSSLLHFNRSKRWMETRNLVSYLGALARYKPREGTTEAIQNSSSKEFFLEVLPIVRRIALLETDSELVESASPVDDSARVTRNSSRRRRKHYFEKLGFVRLKERDITASQAGERCAASLLLYNKNTANLSY